jgi:hypothetical protein
MSAIITIHLFIWSINNFYFKFSPVHDIQIKNSKEGIKLHKKLISKNTEFITITGGGSTLLKIYLSAETAKRFMHQRSN